MQVNDPARCSPCFKRIRQGRIAKALDYAVSLADGCCTGAVEVEELRVCMLSGNRFPAVGLISERLFIPPIIQFTWRLASCGRYGMPLSPTRHFNSVPQQCNNGGETFLSPAPASRQSGRQVLRIWLFEATHPHLPGHQFDPPRVQALPGQERDPFPRAVAGVEKVKSIRDNIEFSPKATRPAPNTISSPRWWRKPLPPGPRPSTSPTP